MAKKLVKKAAVAAANKKSKVPATKAVTKSAPKPAHKKAAPAKSALSASSSKKSARIEVSKANNVSAKAAVNGSKAASHPAKPVHPSPKAVNGKVVLSTPARVEPMARGANAKPGKAVAIVVKPTAKGEAPKPSGRPMLLQGPVAFRPMGKKATLPPTPPKPAEKPVRKKVIASGEPAFVVVQPPTKAVATSERAAKNKAGLSQKDLDFFRDLVLAKRRELLGDMNSMEREALRENSTDLSNLPVHMADQGTDAYEQEFTLHLVEKDRTLLRELNDALAKIQNGTYGICEGTGLPISKPRLEAQPWARYSIEHARALEKRAGMFRR